MNGWLCGRSHCRAIYTFSFKCLVVLQEIIQNAGNQQSRGGQKCQTILFWAHLEVKFYALLKLKHLYWQWWRTF